MELRQTWKKELCMSELRVTHARYEREHHCDSGGGADSARLVVALKGEADIRTQGLCLHINAGDGGLFYIPEGAQYHIIWSGTPEIEYYIFGIIARKFDTDTVTRYDLQRIDGADIASIRAAAAEIVSLFDAGDSVSRVRAIAAYYTMYAEVLPYLRPVPQKRYHSAVSAAMAYIEAHYAEDFAMNTLAAAVCVSESRLYHLFREELRSTPVKYRCAVRIRCAARELLRGEMTLEEIAVRSGFHSAAYFREMFRRETGMTPAAYRELAEGSAETAE